MSSCCHGGREFEGCNKHPGGRGQQARAGSPGQGGLASAECEHSWVPLLPCGAQAKPLVRAKLPQVLLPLQLPVLLPQHLELHEWGRFHVECPLHVGHWI